MKNAENPYGIVRELDATADIEIIAISDTVENLFAATGFALFNLMTDLSAVEPKYRWKVRITGTADFASGLVDWLNELIFLYETKHVFLSRFDVRIREGELTADVWGEEIDPERHEFRMGIKAATYHRLRVERSKEGWIAQVVLDV